MYVLIDEKKYCCAELVFNLDVEDDKGNKKYQIFKDTIELPEGVSNSEIMRVFSSKVSRTLNKIQKVINNKTATIVSDSGEPSEFKFTNWMLW